MQRIRGKCFIEKSVINCLRIAGKKHTKIAGKKDLSGYSFHLTYNERNGFKLSINTSRSRNHRTMGQKLNRKTFTRVPVNRGQ